jgi:rare lipoprotein A
MAVLQAASWFRYGRLVPATSRTVAVLAVCTALAACETGNLQKGKADSASRAVPDVPVTQGRYLVGEPYEKNGVRYHPVEDWFYNEVGTASWYGIDYHGKRTANGETFDLRAMTAAHPTLPLPSRVRVTNIENGKSIELRVNDRGPFKDGRLIDVSERAAETLGFKEKGIARVRVEILGRAPLEVFRMAAPKEPPPDLPVRAAPTATVQAAALTAPLPAAAAETGKSEAKAAPPETRTAAAGAGSSLSGMEEPADPVGELIERMAEKTETESPVRMAAAHVTAAPEPESAPAASSVAGTFFIQAGAFTVPENAYSLRRLIMKAITGANVSINPAQVGDREFFRVRVGPFASTEEANGVLAQLRNLGQNEARIIGD